jgi:hypothetical protein
VIGSLARCARKRRKARTKSARRGQRARAGPKCKRKSRRASNRSWSGSVGAPRNLAVGPGAGASADGDVGGKARSGTVTRGAPAVGRRSREWARGAHRGAKDGPNGKSRNWRAWSKIFCDHRQSLITGSARPTPARPPNRGQAARGSRLAPRSLDRVVHFPCGGLEYAGVLSRTPRHFGRSRGTL